MVIIIIYNLQNNSDINYLVSVSSLRGRRHGVRGGVCDDLQPGLRAVLLFGRQETLRETPLPAAAPRLLGPPFLRSLLSTTILLSTWRY